MIKWCDILNLGKIPDVDLAKELNISPQAVFQARKRNNIPAFNPTPKYKVDWDSVGLGQKTDQHIADIVGCTGACVNKQRKKRKIPAFGMLYRTIENEAAYYEESIIDMWLHNNNINHKFQFKIDKYRVDWLIPDKNEVWEFLGMWEHKIYGEEYRRNFIIKENLLTDMGYSVRRIYKTEMNNFKSGIDLTKIYSMAIFKCRGCFRTNIKHHAKGLCSMCITRFYLNKTLGPPKIQFLKKDESFLCQSCGSTERHKRVEKQCSKCYNKSYKAKRKQNE